MMRKYLPKQFTRYCGNCKSTVTFKLIDDIYICHGDIAAKKTGCGKKLRPNNIFEEYKPKDY